MINKEVINPVGYKIQLNPTEEQKKVFEDYFNISRRIYNFGLNVYLSDPEYIDEVGRIKKKKPFYSLTSELTRYRHSEEGKYLANYDVHTLRKALTDLHNAVEFYLNPNLHNRHPIFKKKKEYTNRKSFAVRNDRLTITEHSVTISSIKTVRTKGITPLEIRGHSKKDATKLPGKYIDYINPRIVYDGTGYFLCINLAEDVPNNIKTASCRKYRDDEIWFHKESVDIIGVDFGCKKDNWLVSSNGTRLSRPDTDKEEEKIKKLQRKFNRQLRVNNERWETANPSSNKRPKTKNELKTLAKWNKLAKKITNKKLDALNCYLSHDILAYKPKAVVIEDIYTENMLITDKNINNYHKRTHNAIVHMAMPYKVKETILKKVRRNNIPVIIADKEYPSTQLCSNCGNRMDIGTKRIYICPVCGMVKNRDENASDNLKLYGQRVLENIEIA